MFRKLIHLLSKMTQQEQDVNQLNKKFILQAEDNFIYDITNGRPYVTTEHRSAIFSGHKKIGDFIQRGIDIQNRKIKEGVA